MNNSQFSIFNYQLSITKYIVVDDVFGNGSSMLTVMKKLYDTTHMLNYFFIVVKDVKR